MSQDSTKDYLDDCELIFRDSNGNIDKISLKQDNENLIPDIFCSICKNHIEDITEKFQYFYTIGSDSQPQHNPLFIVALCSFNCFQKYKRSFNRKSEYLKMCCVCALSFDKVQKCSRCLITQYCSRTCQTKDWIHHKKICVPHSK